MKQFFFMLAACALLHSCNSDNLKLSEVPDSVEATFKSMYPNATDVEWEREVDSDETAYQVEFRMDEDEMSALFSNNGEWLETKTEINPNDLPQAIQYTLSADYPEYEVEEAEEIQTAEDVVMYEVEIEHEATDDELEILFDGDGNILSIEQEDDDD